MAEFEFEAWCEEYELEEDTITLLKDKGFKSYKSLSKISDEMLKKEFKTLIPGQLVLLHEGVKLLRPAMLPPPPPPKTQGLEGKEGGAPPPATTADAAAAVAATSSAAAMPNGQQPLSVTDILTLWQTMSGLQSGATPQMPPPPAPPADPFGFGTGPFKGKKQRKLVDYITNILAIDPSYDAEDTMFIGGVEFAVSRGKKLPMEKVRIPHYMEGCLLYTSDAADDSVYV